MNEPLDGFNTTGWGRTPEDAAAIKRKHDFGVLASQYAGKVNALERLMVDPKFKRYFPEARLCVDFGDGKPVDLLTLAPSVSTAWAWPAGRGLDEAPVVTTCGAAPRTCWLCRAGIDHQPRWYLCFCPDCWRPALIAAVVSGLAWALR